MAPLEVRFAEMWAFIPSQLIPFEKMSLDVWYLQTFYPEYQAQGGGLAFGAVSQAIIGNGLLEAWLRGLALGVISLWLMKWHRSLSPSWWKLPLYLFVYAFAFQSVRDTTFRPMTDVVQTVGPSLLLIGLLASLVSRRWARKIKTQHA